VRIFLVTAARHTSSPVLHFHLSCTQLHVEPTVVAVRAGRETIDRELRLLSAIRRACRERGGVLPSTRPADDIETLWRATSWPDRSGDMAHVVASGETMLP
jgi:hypothetical protein